MSDKIIESKFKGGQLVGVLWGELKNRWYCQGHIVRSEWRHGWVHKLRIVASVCGQDGLESAWLSEDSDMVALHEVHCPLFTPATLGTHPPEGQRCGYCALSLRWGMTLVPAQFRTAHEWFSMSTVDRAVWVEKKDK